MATVQSQGIHLIGQYQEKITENQENVIIDGPQNHPQDETRVCKFHSSIACGVFSETWFWFIFKVLRPAPGMFLSIYRLTSGPIDSFRLEFLEISNLMLIRTKTLNSDKCELYWFLEKLRCNSAVAFTCEFYWWIILEH